MPIYYLPRYQTEAVVKLIAGLNYDYDVKGWGEFKTTEPVAKLRQESALDAVLATLKPQNYYLGAELLSYIPPKAMGYYIDRENAASHTKPQLDPVTMAEAAMEETLKLLLDPARLSRANHQHHYNAELPDASRILNRLFQHSIQSSDGEVKYKGLKNRLDILVVEHLLELTLNNKAAPEVAGQAYLVLQKSLKQLKRGRTEQAPYLVFLIESALELKSFQRRSTVAKMPPGSPI